MLVLALDTSTDVAVSLVEVGVPGERARSLAASRARERRRHAELLAPMVRDVLAEAGVDRRDLGVVAVGTGPAPFTGLRAGLVTARVLGEALGIPVHGLPSLDVWAAQAFMLGVAGDGGDGYDTAEVVVATDARRREVYTARYRRRAGDRSGDRSATAGLTDVETVFGPEVMAPAALAPTVGAAAVVGPGTALYPEHLTASPGGPDDLDPAVLAGLAVSRAAAGAALPTEPLYLRRPDVMPAAARKRVTG